MVVIFEQIPANVNGKGNKSIPRGPDQVDTRYMYII